MHHKDEIIRWANSKEGTKVWVNYPNEDIWYLLENTIVWHPKNKYIVNDKYADIRKAYDLNPDLEIEVYDEDTREWVPIPDPSFKSSFDYRVGMVRHKYAYYNTSSRKWDITPEGFNSDEEFLLHTPCQDGVTFYKLERKPI